MEEDESLLKMIYHYQGALERYISNHNESKEAKMLHCINRLNSLPIKMSHLEKTGVGRTVNSLRKVEGEVGNAAKALVSKWKDVVVMEEKIEAEDEENGSVKDSDKLNVASQYNNSADKRNSDKQRSETSGKKRESSSHKPKKHHDEMSSKRKKSSSDSEDEEINSKSKNLRHDDEIDKSYQDKEPASSEKNRSSKDKSSSSSSKHKKHKKNLDNDDNDKHKKSKHEKHRSEHDKNHSSKNKSKKHKHKDEKVSKSEDCKKESKKEHKHEESIGHDSKNKTKSSSSSSSKKSTKSKDASTSSIIITNGIGSGAGTSFADALGMCEPIKIRSSPKKKAKPSKEPVKETYSSSEEERDDSSPINDLKLDLLKEPKLEPLDINLSSLLPPITPTYKPLGLPISDSTKKRVWTDEEALSRVMSNKNQRTKVFSGNKSAWTKVPSLFELCIRLLQDNIDAIEYTGGVPYLILKPILEKANANQLFTLESYNPYLMEDSDELWKFHCDREFKNKRREEMETWRDMYIRCYDEREKKLKALTANIKLAQDKSLPVRTTKLAYVDSVAKPPRNVARKQAKNEALLNNRPSLSSKLATLATAGEAGKVAVPNPGHRAKDRASTAGSSSSISHKPKKAPLMMKALSLLKNRYRR